jgi:hypothetical protein
VADFRLRAAEADLAEVLFCWAALGLYEQPADFRVREAESESAEVPACSAGLRLCERAADFRAARARSVLQPVDFRVLPAHSYEQAVRLG